MKNMKWILVAVMVLATMLSMCACGESEPTVPATTTQTPVATTTTLAPVPTTTVNDGMATYTVTVLYPDGTPVVGVDVQICLAETCYMPTTTDENGQVTYRLAEQDGYMTKLVVTPEGYEKVDYIHFESGVTEVTIQLVELAA